MAVFSRHGLLRASRLNRTGLFRAAPLVRADSTSTTANPTHFPDPTPAPIKTALRQLYRSGTGPKKTAAGQPRVVVITTGGGGHAFAWLLSEPGASSCLLEGLVPYDKQVQFEGETTTFV